MEAILTQSEARLWLMLTEWNSLDDLAELAAMRKPWKQLRDELAAVKERAERAEAELQESKSKVLAMCTEVNGNLLKERDEALAKVKELEQPQQQPGEVQLEAGWLARQLQEVQEEVAKWPDIVKQLGAINSELTRKVGAL